MIKIDWKSWSVFLCENGRRIQAVWQSRAHYQHHVFVYFKSYQKQDWHKVFMMISVCLGVIGLLAGVLPLYFQYDALQSEIIITENKLHLMKMSEGVDVPIQKEVVRPSGWEPILKAARDNGVSILQFETTSQRKTNLIFHLVAEASLTHVAAWLHALSLLEVGVNFSSLDIQTEVNGELRMNMNVSLGHDISSAAWPAFPIGNPFCHAISLEEAKSLAEIPLLARYPLADIQFIGLGVSHKKRFGLLRLPGGATMSVSVGDAVGQESAVLASLTAHVMRLKMPTSYYVSKKIMNEE